MLQYAIVLTVSFIAILVVMMTGQLKMSAANLFAKTSTGGVAKGGAPSRGMAYRSYEGDLAAVDTIGNLTAFGGTAQTVIVPQGASIIDRIAIGMSLDLGGAMVSVRGHCQIRLVGQGVVGSPHDFGGPALTVQGLTSGNAIGTGNVEYRDLAIPVVDGGEIQVQAVLIGEDPGDATVSVTLGYILA